MNYINKLREENKELKNQLSEIKEDLNTFLIYLNSSKFQGVENNWINSSEVVNWARELRQRTLID